REAQICSWPSIGDIPRPGRILIKYSDISIVTGYCASVREPDLTGVFFLANGERRRCRPDAWVVATAVKIRERSVVRSFQKMQRHDSNGRILNLLDYSSTAERRSQG